MLGVEETEKNKHSYTDRNVEKLGFRSISGMLTPRNKLSTFPKCQTLINIPNKLNAFSISDKLGKSKQLLLEFDIEE